MYFIQNIQFVVCFKLRSLNVRFVSRKMTIQDGLERCLKKGKSEEQAQAAFCLVLLCVQMGAGDESEEIFKQLRSMLTTVLSDSSASLKARTAVSKFISHLYVRY